MFKVREGCRNIMVNYCSMSWNITFEDSGGQFSIHMSTLCLKMLNLWEIFHPEELRIQLKVSI
jgi:hypothetical protein